MTSRSRTDDDTDADRAAHDQLAPTDRGGHQVPPNAPEPASGRRRDHHRPVVKESLLAGWSL
jgi:hypothetical protein